MGNDFSKGVDSAVAIITGIITGDVAGGLAGASAPWLAEQIKLHTGDNEAARLIAHSILGAVVAELQGNSGLAGGAGAVAGEVAADIIRKQLYGKEVKDLTEEEKETISALSQLATGLAIAAGGGNIGDASAAISSSKNAVENNSVGPWHGGDIIGLSPETGANYDSIVHASAAGYLTLEEAFQIIDDMNSGKYMYDPLREDLKRFPEDLAILVTPYGDYIAFRDADSWGDYAIAIAGVLPFVKYIKVVGKVVKVETIAAQALVKEAEAAYKAGNVAEGNRLMNQVASQSTQVETTVIRQAHSSNAGKGTNSATQADAAKYFGQERKYWSKDPIEFNGNKVYQRNDLFDPNLMTTWTDKRKIIEGTNLERMASGRAPIGHDGNPINLHHMTQNKTVIHVNPNTIPSGINRGEFNKWKTQYWIERAKTYR